MKPRYTIYFGTYYYIIYGPTNIGLSGKCYGFLYPGMI